MQNPVESPPIVAIATATGRGGIGVVRVSGKNLHTVMEGLLAKPLTPRYAHFAEFLAADGSALDHGIALYFPAPHSFTGESVLELQGHGGRAVLQLVLARCLELGCRLAEAGEFTKRAFLNGKLDLAQAESVADLIDATSEAAARSALRSLSGVFSQHVRRLVEGTIHLRMLVEASIDFPEEDIDFLAAADAMGQLTGLQAQLAETLATMVSPPHSSACRPSSASSRSTRSGSAPGLSILFTATMMGTLAAREWLMASRVCSMTPSSAATTRITRSVT